MLLLVMAAFVMQGTGSAGENFQQIDSTLEVAFQHARSYPPLFDTDSQRENLEKELKGAIARLENMLESSEEKEQILFRLLKANTFAFNLDLPGSREKTDEYSAKLFRLDPGHPEGHLYYGQHLSGRGEFEAAIEHLQVAADAGWDVALNMMGLSYLQMGKEDEAKVYFQKLQNKYPDDQQVQMLLDSLEPSGEYEYKLMRE